MTENEVRKWIEEHYDAATMIARSINRWRSASSRALSDPKADRLASYFEARAVEVYMDCGGTEDFRDVHLIGSIASEMQKAGTL